MDDNLKISVIVASLNNAATLRGCLESFVGQDYPHKELVIMDGGSTDETRLILDEYESSILYRESAPDRGVYHAWNKALDHVGGEWVYFLGADDRFAGSDVLSRAAQRLRDCPKDIRVAYGLVFLATREGELIEVLGKPWRAAKSALSKKLTIPPLGTFFHADLFQIHGKFDESFLIAGDYDFLLRELTRRPAFFMWDLVVALWRVGGVSSNPQHAVTLKLEDSRARKNNGLPPYSVRWAWELFKAFVLQILSQRLGPESASRIRNAYRRLSNKSRIS